MSTALEMVVVFRDRAGFWAAFWSSVLADRARVSTSLKCFRRFSTCMDSLSLCCWLLHVNLHSVFEALADSSRVDCIACKRRIRSPSSPRTSPELRSVMQMRPSSDQESADAPKDFCSLALIILIPLTDWACLCRLSTGLPSGSVDTELDSTRETTTDVWVTGSFVANSLSRSHFFRKPSESPVMSEPELISNSSAVTEQA